jgi:AcrR family transcriptional regulator
VKRIPNDDNRKHQIRTAATRCFVRRGYAATRLADIAKEAGMSKGGVYFHYRAKEEIFHDILESLSRSLQERWTFDTITEQAADRSLGQLVRAHLRHIQSDPEEVRLQNLLVAMAAQDSMFRDKLEEVTGIMRGLYEGVIERGSAEGVFITGDSSALATSVLAYINGIGALSVLDSKGRLPVSPEEAAEQVLRMLRPRRSASSVEFGPGPSFN